MLHIFAYVFELQADNLVFDREQLDQGPHFLQFEFPKYNSKRPCDSLPTSDNFCCLLISFTSSLDPDQGQQIVGLIWIQTV